MKRITSVYCLAIVYVMISQFQQCGSTLALCEPAEESKGHTLSFNLDNIEDPVNAVLDVIKDKLTISKCSIQRGCENFKEKLFKANANLNAISSNITISVEMYNVSRVKAREIGREWHILLNESIISSCKTSVFKRIERLPCQYNVSDNIYFITCLASKVYPEGRCEILVTLGPEFNSTKYVHTVNDVISMNPLYFKTKCFIALPLNEIGPGSYKILVMMYPNVHDNEKDKKLGENKYFTFTVDYPSVALKDCPDILEENSEVTCTCDRSDNRLINVSIGWFDHNDTQIETKNGKLTLKVNDFRPTLSKGKGLFCKIIGPLKWMNSNSTKLYSPIVIGKILIAINGVFYRLYILLPFQLRHPT